MIELLNKIQNGCKEISIELDKMLKRRNEVSVDEALACCSNIKKKASENFQLANDLSNDCFKDKIHIQNLMTSQMKMLDEAIDHLLDVKNEQGDFK
jgi:conjugal transfer/entry exclusion protein